MHPWWKQDSEGCLSNLTQNPKVLVPESLNFFSLGTLEISTKRCFFRV
uniref:Uncharacterized protein n=1 Tax=Arundo donax TaxID=35708 RepID=A0A0A8XP79_ARUDO